MEVSDSVQNAFEEAKQVRERAYAPYSNFKVGASLKVKGVDELLIGCNVENASYGATICAERSAILNAVARYGKIEIEYIMIVTDQENPAVPCALCLQVMSEFTRPEAAIYLGSLEKVVAKYRFDQLLPNPFTEFTPS